MDDQRALAIGFGLIGLGFFIYYLSRKLERHSSNTPSPLCWPGGQSRIVKELEKMAPPHKTYVEPFAGAAWLYFAKKPAKVNVLNDLDPELIDFYKKFEKLKEPPACTMWPDKEKFERLKKKKEKSICDYLYVNKYSFGCNMESYAKKKCEFETCRIGSSISHFDEIKKKLWRARLLNKDFRNVIKEYDNPDTFAYLDPPYHEIELYRYGKGLSAYDVADAVKGLKSKWLMTYNDHPDVWDAFKGYYIKPIDKPYSFSRTGYHKTKDLVITNYKPEAHRAREAWARVTGSPKIARYVG